MPVLAVVAIFAILAGGMACNSAPVNPPAGGSDLDIVKSAMSFIGQHHPEAAALINSGASYAQAGSGGKGKLGYSAVTYTGNGWTIKIGHAVTAEIIYEISADYQNGKITWTGQSKDGTLTEQSYNQSK